MAALTAPLVSLENVSKAYATTVVLDGVSLGVAAGERIGVVGRNGGGKTTLLRMLTGAEAPDAGRVARTGGLRIGYVDQRGDPPGEHRARRRPGRVRRRSTSGPATPRSARCSAGSGCRRIGLDAPVEPAVRRRAAPGRAGRGRWSPAADLLVLDEPTNHLDVEGVAWLAEHLQGRAAAALVVVTHDRWFLDAVCDADLGGRRRHGAAGTTAATPRTCWPGPSGPGRRAASEGRRQNLLRKELAWLRRGPPARTSKPRFRIEAAQALIADEPPPRDSTPAAGVRRRAGSARACTTSRTSRVAVGDAHPARPRDLALGPGDRVGVVGVNGAGKTTCCGCCSAGCSRTAGRSGSARPSGAGYLSQEVAELPAGAAGAGGGRGDRPDRPTSAAWSCPPSSWPSGSASAAHRQWTPVADLSGGERRRLQLLRLLMAEPNVLLLDEPTNDLDTDTLAALEDLLDSWPGTLRRGQPRPVPGRAGLRLGGRAARRRLAGRAARRGRGVPGRAAGPPGRPRPPGRRPARRAQGDTRADARAARRELIRLERRIATLERQEAQLHEQLAEHATDYERVLELDTRLRAVGGGEGRGRVGLAGAGGDRGADGALEVRSVRSATDGVPAMSMLGLTTLPVNHPPAPGLPGRRPDRRRAAGRVRRRSASSSPATCSARRRAPRSARSAWSRAW